MLGIPIIAFEEPQTTRALKLPNLIIIKPADLESYVVAMKEVADFKLSDFEDPAGIAQILEKNNSQLTETLFAISKVVATKT